MIKKCFLLFKTIGLILFLIITNSSIKENQNSLKPIIYNVFPDKAFTGDEITIYGDNFGDKQGQSKVYFGEISCADYDFDYISWSNKLIKIKVPTGAVSDYIKISINNEIINGPFFISQSQSSHDYTNPLELNINYSISVSPVNSDINKPLYLWMPSPVPSDKQRDVKLIEASRNYLETENNFLDLFKADKLTYNKDVVFDKKFYFKNYEVHTNINPDDIECEYDKNTDFYKYYTSSEYGVESNDKRIIEVSKEILKDEKNPYLQAKLIYNWVVKHMDYQYPPPNRSWRAITGLTTGRGDCAVYSFLFTALCRAAGIPARSLAGHVIFMNNYICMHFWAEFYLPKIGWIPVDANYGDVQVEGFKPRSFYFGNMDNRHIAFSKGRVNLYLPDYENNGIEKDFCLSYLQKYHIFLDCKDSDKLYTVKRSLTLVK